MSDPRAALRRRRAAALRAPLALMIALAWTTMAAAQVVTYRGSLEARATIFPQEAVNDPERLIGDARARLDVFVKPAGWMLLEGGLEGLGNTYGQVEGGGLNITDRGLRRPALALRRLNVTLTRRALTVQAGKQVVRWGKTDVVTPTDRFAPRDFLSVIDADSLAVRAVRAAVATRSDTVEGVVSVFTPSRTPLLDQRWTVRPAGVGPVAFDDRGSRFPSRLQAGLRWSHIGRGHEYSVSFFDGFNHLPNIDLAAALPVGTPAAGAPLVVSLIRTFPTLRMYGADTALPTAWFTLKGEVAYFRTQTAGTDEYVLYVVQLERQTGEWLLIGGYAGEIVTDARALANFAPDRGSARAFVGRASYTIDPNRSAAVEAAVRQSGTGVYVKGEFSEAVGRHWRATLTGAVIGGEAGDFLGQYRRNSHIGLSLRFSF